MSDVQDLQEVIQRRIEKAKQAQEAREAIPTPARPTVIHPRTPMAEFTTEQVEEAIETVAEFKSLRAQKQEATRKQSELTGKKASDIVPLRAEWLWRGWLAKGAVHVIAGKQGMGKSIISTWIAAKMLKEHPTLKVAFLSLEEAEGAIAARIIAHGINPSRVTIYGSVTTYTDAGEVSSPWRLPTHTSQLEDALLKDGIGFIVIDGAGYAVTGQQDYANVGSVLSALAGVADRVGTAILLITHTAKGGSHDASVAAIGSTAWTAIPRLGWVLGADPSNPDDKQRGVLAVAKSNFARPEHSIAFTIGSWADDPDVGVITDISETDVSADAVVAPRESYADRSARSELVQAIEVTLQEGGEMTRKELLTVLKSDGLEVSERSFNRAVKEANVSFERSGFPSVTRYRHSHATPLKTATVTPHGGASGVTDLTCGNTPNTGGETLSHAKPLIRGATGATGDSDDSKTEVIHSQKEKEKEVLDEPYYEPEDYSDDSENVVVPIASRFPKCSTCNGRLLSPKSQERGFCDRCRLHPKEPEIEPDNFFEIGE